MYELLLNKDASIPAFVDEIMDEASFKKLLELILMPPPDKIEASSPAMPSIFAACKSR